MSPNPLQATFTIGVKEDSSGTMMPDGVSCDNPTIRLNISMARPTVTFKLQPAPNSPYSTELRFARPDPAWGGIHGVVIKEINSTDVDFPSSWSQEARSDALEQIQQKVKNIQSVEYNDRLDTATITLDPLEIEPTEGVVEIHLPYTVNYWISAYADQWGVYQYDPEMTIKTSM